MKVQTNYCNNNLLILDVKQLNEIIKLYYFHTLEARWDGQGYKAAISKKVYGLYVTLDDEKNPKISLKFVGKKR